jgi:hypothetical protein
MSWQAILLSSFLPLHGHGFSMSRPDIGTKPVRKVSLDHDGKLPFCSEANGLSGTPKPEKSKR